jgi:hypothetical protein
MFAYPISVTSLTSAAVGTDPSYTYSDEIDLMAKRHDRSRLSLHLALGNDAGSSAQVSVVGAIAAQSGATFANFITGSGTSLILQSATTSGGSGNGTNGSYFVPITIVPTSGSTLALTGASYVKLGFLAAFDDVTTMLAHLIVG